MRSESNGAVKGPGWMLLTRILLLSELISIPYPVAVFSIRESFVEFFKFFLAACQKIDIISETKQIWTKQQFMANFQHRSPRKRPGNTHWYSLRVLGNALVTTEEKARRFRICVTIKKPQEKKKNRGKGKHGGPSVVNTLTVVCQKFWTWRQCRQWL